MCSDWLSYFNKASARSLLFENKMADKSRMRVYNENEFSSALHEALSCRAGQKGCLRRIICLRKDVLAVLQANLD